ncbi:MAG: sulfatase, partial [Planctomycetota bacterium]
WFGYLNQKNAHSYYPPYLWRNEEKFMLGGNADGKRGTYAHNLFTDFALDFIRRKAGKPFFLYCAYTAPHSKYEIPDTAPYTDKDWPADARVHAAMITLLDADVGRIMKLLKELNIDKNTIVFFCSDNGAARRWEGIFDSSGPLRGRKRDMYEGGIRTPMIARWPGRVGEGAVNKSPWYFADFLPTAADLAKTSVPDNIDGISVLPLICGEKQNTANRFMYWEYFESGHIQIAVRWRNFKAVRLKPGAPLELYNLDEDIGESTNIAEKHPQIIAMIEKWLTTARTESANWPTK